MERWLFGAQVFIEKVAIWSQKCGKILALLGGCDRNTLKKWRANVRTARRLYLVSPASALIGAVLLCGMIEEVMLKHICEDSTRRHMQSCESATIDAKLVKSNVLLKSCSRLCCLDAQNYFPCRAPRTGLEGRRGTSFCKSGKVLSHRDGFAPHFTGKRDFAPYEPGLAFIGYCPKLRAAFFDRRA